MHLSPSAHADTFARDHLPPPELWPTIEFTTDAVHYPDRLNAGVELVDVPAKEVGEDSPALRTPDGTTWTYGELRRRSDQIAQVLVEDLGLVPGNRVMLRSPNNPWTVAAWLGVHAALMTGGSNRVEAFKSWAQDYFGKERAPQALDRSGSGRMPWEEDDVVEAMTGGGA